MTQAYSIVDEANFILTTRDTGYKSTASAVAELVDNSIQAGAKRIDINVWQEGVGSERLLFLSVLDNGHGMTNKELRTALRFGGTSRFNDRTGLGRFGMGLPNSMASQARRLEVYTWRGGATPLYCYLDIDEIHSGEMNEVPEAKRRKLPEISSGSAGKSGTLVLWSKCDRLDARKASTVIEKIVPTIAQKFRYSIWSGVGIRVNGLPVSAHDPLMVKTVDGVPAATEFGQAYSQEIRCEKSGMSGIVTIRFSELPVAKLSGLGNEEKTKLGISKGAGISVIRCGREIDYGWFFMGGKRKENYDDWWRCEIRFPAELDEMFGVTHSKQEINPTEELKRLLTPVVSSGAHAMHSRVRAAFRALKSPQPEAKVTPIGQATVRSSKLQRNAILQPGQKETFAIRASTTVDDVIFEHEVSDGGKHTITLNKEHIFYRDLYVPSPREVQEKLGLLLAAIARTDLMSSDGRKKFGPLDRARLLGDTLSVFLGE